MDTYTVPKSPPTAVPPVPYLSYPPGLGVDLAHLTETFDELPPTHKKEGKAGGP
jgi:hypothetical protein